jgi:hypothetical protein
MPIVSNHVVHVEKCFLGLLLTALLSAEGKHWVILKMGVILKTGCIFDIYERLEKIGVILKIRCN